MNASILCALIAAALFGASTPLAKMLIGDCPPILLAGLLYLGSGLGLTIARVVRDRDYSISKRCSPRYLRGSSSKNMLITESS